MNQDAVLIGVIDQDPFVKACGETFREESGHAGRSVRAAVAAIQHPCRSDGTSAPTSRHGDELVSVPDPTVLPSPLRLAPLL
jgi:hypothetical protein